MFPWEMQWDTSGAAPAAPAAPASGSGQNPWEMRWAEEPSSRVRRIATEVSGGDPAFVDFASRLAQVESSGGKKLTGPEVKSGMHAGDRARGIWQIMPKTFADMGGRNLDDPDEVDRLGAKYLHDNWQRFGRDERKAAQAHIAGPGSVRADGVVPRGGDGYTTTRDYVNKATAGAPAQPAQPAFPWQMNWTK